MRRSFSPKRWHILPGDPQAEAVLKDELNVHPMVARMLVQRGLSNPQAAYNFLNPSLDQLHDPFLLPDAEVACERLKTALHNKEKIYVYGDYDGDGVTSAALWTRCLRSLGGDVSVFVPHRKRDGYDMRNEGVEKAKADGASLIVTTDCGIQRIDEVELARQYGIDVIVTDHHTPNKDGALPNAVAVVNPHRHDSRYPFPDIAGVGVAFKMGEALTRYLGHKADAFRRSFLDLAAIGTVTDIMPLLDENRVIVSYGIAAMLTTKKPGITELLTLAGRGDKPINSRTISWGLGPRLNAASRVDETKIALDLLLTKDPEEAHTLARRLNDLNAQRQTDQASLMEEIQAQIAQQDVTETRCFVLHGSGPNWKSGLVGLVAGKIVERYHRPCVVIAVSDETGQGKGSARSTSAFNIFEAISDCRDLLDEFGGHAHAAGLAMDKTRIADFAHQMNHLAATRLSDEDLLPTIPVTAEVDPTDMTLDLLDQLAAMEPFGHANPEPMFVSRGVSVNGLSCMGKENQHLKLFLKTPGLNPRHQTDGIWWNQGELASGLETMDSLDVCFQPETNFWNGTNRIQFMLRDIHAPEW